MCFVVSDNVVGGVGDVLVHWDVIVEFYMNFVP
jgi:hypothetical protein